MLGKDGEEKVSLPKMRVAFSDHFRRSYHRAPAEVRKAFDRKLSLLLQDLRHPSLRAKKYDETAGVWQARVNRDWRFYFTIAGDMYRIHEIIAHPK